METPAPVELVRSSELTDVAPYAYAAVAHGVSRLVFTAGACPLDANGNTVAIGDVAGQAEQVMANLEVALRAAGAGLRDVVKTTVFVVDLADFDIVNRIYGEHFEAPYPARSTVQVSALPRNALVEIEAIARR